MNPEEIELKEKHEAEEKEKKMHSTLEKVDEHL